MLQVGLGWFVWWVGCRTTGQFTMCLQLSLSDSPFFCCSSFGVFPHDPLFLDGLLDFLRGLRCGV